MRITLKDIAKATGLSVATVSLVLNDKPHKISEATRQLVKDKAKEMNYIPNQLARGLAKSKSKIITFVIPDITNTYFTEMARVIEDEASKEGYQVVVCDTRQMIERQEEYIKMSYENNGAGIIMAMDMNTKQQKLIELITQLDLNIILIDGSTELNIDSVVMNQQYGSYLASTHLIEMGHRKIGCITGPKDIITSKERLKGYQKALEEHGIPFDGDYVYEGNYQVASGAVGAEALLEKGVTAIYAFNDMMACGIYRAASERGYRIPEDISIMGFDNIHFSQVLPTPLTTIEQPIEEMAQQAIKRLIERIESPRTLYPRCYVFRPKLIKRGSVRRI